MKTEKTAKSTKAQKINLARCMTYEKWQELCGSNDFTRALDTDIELARMIAEDYHYNGALANHSPNQI